LTAWTPRAWPSRPALTLSSVSASGTEGADALIEEAVACYVRERVPHLKSGNAAAAELAGMYWAYQGRPLSALPDVCKAYKLRARKDDGTPLAPATVRNRIRYLVSACRWGWREHGMSDHDPAEAVTVPAVANERQVYIDRRQMLQAARACTNSRARMAIRIAFYSGMRLSEILRAEPRGTAWVLQDSKNGNPRIVPIHPRVAVCARSFEREGPKITIQRAWERARAKVGLRHVHFHDLRHSAASELIRQGVDLFTVGRILGHSDSRSTARYAHHALEALTDAVGRIGRKNPTSAHSRAA
jgi:integrase